MDDASVGDGKGPAKTVVGKTADHLGEIRRHIRPAPRACAAGGKAADRIDAETDVDCGRRYAVALHQSGEIADDVPRRRAKIKVERDAGRRDRCRRGRGQAPPAEGSRPKPLALIEFRKNQNEAGRAVFQISQRLRIGGRGIGMIDALQDGPGLARGTARNDMGRPVALIERLDWSGRHRSCFRASRMARP